VRIAHREDVDAPDRARARHRGTIACVDNEVVLFTLNTDARTPT
jgi:hypothetical protein